MTKYTEDELQVGAQVLDLKMGDNDAGAPTIRHYLALLVWGVWDEDEGFDGKRPFGNSGWQDELIDTLADHGWIVEDDRMAGDNLIRYAITSMGLSAKANVAGTEAPIDALLKRSNDDLARAQRILDELNQYGVDARAQAIAQAHALANVAMGCTHLAKMLGAAG